jgi:hypothetical protein
MSAELENSNLESTKTSNASYEEDIEKYTKIDNLDEDNGDVHYVLVSFVSPEKVMNCNIRGLKIRHYRNRPAIFSDYALAQKAAQELNEREKYFDIFVMSTGRWCAWDPSPDDRTKVESEKWADKDQQEIMDNLERMSLEKQKKDLNDLNALVGKKKEMINQNADEHKERIANSIKQGIAEKKLNQETQSQNVNGEVNENNTVNNTLLSEVYKDNTLLSEVYKDNTLLSEVYKDNTLLSEVYKDNTRARGDTRNIKDKLRRKLEEKRRTEKTLQRPPSNLNTIETMNNSLKSEVTNQEQLEANINKAKAILDKLQQNKAS